MASDEDTEWPNISKCSFFLALLLYQISCFPPKVQDWLDIGSYAPALQGLRGEWMDGCISGCILGGEISGEGEGARKNFEKEKFLKNDENNISTQGGDYPF